MRETLVSQGVDQPFIMLTGHGTVDMCRRTFKWSAAAFFEKPVNHEHMLEALQGKGQCRADGDQPIAGLIGAREDGAGHCRKSDGVLRKGINMTRDIVINALRMTWFKRHPSKQAGLVFHSESGSQYASKDFRDVLKEYGIASSTTTITPTANTLQHALPRW